MAKNEEIKLDSELKILNKLGVEPYLIEYLIQQKYKQEIAKKFD